MASGIPSNFNTPKLGKTHAPKNAPATPAEEKPASDSVQLTGTGFAAPLVAGLAANMLQANPDLTPGEVKEMLVSASKGGTINPEAALAAAKRSPIHLSMDETTGIGPIGDSKNADKGHGLTGLNSLASVVASGKFEGLNGSYGADRPFGF